MRAVPMLKHEQVAAAICCVSAQLLYQQQCAFRRAVQLYFYFYSPMGQVVWPVISPISCGSLKDWICRACFQVLKYLDSLPSQVSTWIHGRCFIC